MHKFLPAALAALGFLAHTINAQPTPPRPSATVTVSATAIPAPPEPLGVEYMKSHYTKYEFEIPMRDGKKLFTAVYVPKDLEEKYPMMLMRTPYSVGPYGVDNYPARLGPSDLFAKAGYIFVNQDVRGRNLSEGEFSNMTPHRDVKHGNQDVDESSDTYDTIDWLVKNIPNNNGKVGQYGISYPGFYTAAGMIDAHPALKASSPQAPITDWFVGDDFHHNGTLYLPHAFGFFNGFGRPRPEPVRPTPQQGLRATSIPTDGYRYYLEMGPLANANEKFFKNDVGFWNEMMKHPDYDEFWQSRDLRRHLKNIKPAVMTVGGWFDAEDLFGALKTYKSVEQNSPGAQNTLVMGPWFHGGWSRGDGDHLGFVNFNSKTSEFYRENIELPFFEYWLKGKGDGKLPEAFVFETGTNVWRREDNWPPKGVQSKTLYFQKGGKLSFDAPSETGFEEYISDPAKPVPFINGQSPGMTREHMVEDQRFASTRTDVVTFQSDVLKSDVTIAGPLTSKLFVSTTGTDSDFVVKLIDVYADDFPDPDPNPAGVHMGGFEQLLRGEAFRGKYRNSFAKPEPFTPGKMEKIEYEMPDVYHTFRKGHKIMVQVQSSWFPLVDRNPQKFLNIYEAKSTDFVKATERVYFGGSSSSGVQVLVK
jgi:putative CocE/NonD family hydrolase